MWKSWNHSEIFFYLGIIVSLCGHGVENRCISNSNCNMQLWYPNRKIDATGRCNRIIWGVQAFLNLCMIHYSIPSSWLTNSKDLSKDTLSITSSLIRISMVSRPANTLSPIFCPFISKSWDCTRCYKEYSTICSVCIKISLLFPKKCIPFLKNIFFEALETFIGDLGVLT